MKKYIMPILCCICFIIIIYNFITGAGSLLDLLINNPSPVDIVLVLIIFAVVVFLVTKK